MKDVVGKVAVVTGGGQGIGRALIEKFCSEGMRAVVADVVPDRVGTTTAELRDRGFDVTGVVTDVTSTDSLAALREATLEAYGAVHLLVNNAAVGSASEGRIWEHHPNDWRWSFDVNVQGVVNGLNAFVPTMIAQDVEGHVVNVTSGNGGFTPLIDAGVYAATKAAVTTITECLWGQLRTVGAKVSASLLYPSTPGGGLLETGIWRPGAHRPARYDRPGAPPPEGRDVLTPFLDSMEKAGVTIAFAPLAEVADLCFEGIRDDTFWITATGDDQSRKILARATSQIERTDPSYLVGPNFMKP